MRREATVSRFHFACLTERTAAIRPAAIDRIRVKGRNFTKLLTMRRERDKIEEKRRKTMFCSNCGKEIPDDSVKCPDCGQEVKREQPQTNKKDALSFLEKLHPCTMTALLLSALSVILFIFEIVFMAKNPIFASARTLLLYFGIGGVLLTSIGYQKSEKKAFDKLINLINLGCALLAVLMAIISFIVLMALV